MYFLGAFLIPLLSKLESNRKNYGVRGLLITPTNELAEQSYHELIRLSNGKKFKISCLKKTFDSNNSNNSDLTYNYYNNYDIIISTPMKLLNLLKSNEQIELIK